MTFTLFITLSPSFLLPPLSPLSHSFSLTCRVHPSQIRSALYIYMYMYGAERDIFSRVRRMEIHLVTDRARARAIRACARLEGKSSADAPISRCKPCRANFAGLPLTSLCALARAGDNVRSCKSFSAFLAYRHRREPSVHPVSRPMYPCKISSGIYVMAAATKCETEKGEGRRIHRKFRSVYGKEK